VAAEQRRRLVLGVGLVADGAAERVLDEAEDLGELLVPVEEVALAHGLVLHLGAQGDELGLLELEGRVLLLEERDLALERVEHALLEPEDVLELAHALDGRLAGLREGQRKVSSLLGAGHRAVQLRERERGGKRRTPTAMRWLSSSSALRCMVRESNVSGLELQGSHTRAQPRLQRRGRARPAPPRARETTTHLLEVDELLRHALDDIVLVRLRVDEQQGGG